MQTLKSQWGSVKPYTRHLSTCPNSAGKEEYNRCSCPKWIYTNRRGIDRETNFPYQPARYTLNTPSWSEALEVATSTLKGFDPEIAKARAAEADKEAKQINVESAIRLWLDRTRNLVGEKSSTVNDYRSLLGWRDRKNRARGVMLKYVEQWNSEHPEETISCIQNITALWLQRWHDSPSFSFANTTKRNRWGVIRSFFAWLHRRGVLESNPAEGIERVKNDGEYHNLPYTKEQYHRILSEADWYVDDRVQDGEREVYCRRMHAFAELARWTGMDAIDLVLFRPAEQVDRAGVLRYRRVKTGQEAVIPLEPQVVDLLRHGVPLAPDSVPDQPFRTAGIEVKSDVHNWSRRFKKLCGLAEVRVLQHVINGRIVKKAATLKALRHTFACHYLSVVRLRTEVVARMLGHKLTSTTEKHYLPWIPARDEHHINEVREAQALANKRQLVVASREGMRVAAASTAKVANIQGA